MAQKLKYQLDKEDLINQLSLLGEKAHEITNTLAVNIGKAPLVTRRAKTIEQKIQEMMGLIQDL